MATREFTYEDSGWEGALWPETWRAEAVAGPGRLRPGGGLRYVSDASPGIRRRRSGKGLQLRRSRWPPCAGSGDARPDPEPRHSPGLHRRVDLSDAQRAPAGHWPGRPGPETVPLPPQVARGSGRDQVRPDAGVQRLLAAICASGSKRTWPDRDCLGKKCWPPSFGCSSAPRYGWGTTSTPEPTARSASPRCATITSRSRARGSVRVPRQERQDAQGGALRPPVGPHRSALPGAARSRAVSVRG